MCPIVFKHRSNQLSCQKHGRYSGIGLDKKFSIALIWNMAKHEMTRLLIARACWTWCRSDILVTLPLQRTTTTPTTLPQPHPTTQGQPVSALPPLRSHATSDKPRPLKWSQPSKNNNSRPTQHHGHLTTAKKTRKGCNNPQTMISTHKNHPHSPPSTSPIAKHKASNATPRNNAWRTRTNDRQQRRMNNNGWWTTTDNDSNGRQWNR